MNIYALIDEADYRASDARTHADNEKFVDAQNALIRLRDYLIDHIPKIKIETQPPNRRKEPSQ